MRNLLCIVDFNKIASIGSIAELLLILIWVEGFYHINLVNHRISSVILTAGFGVGGVTVQQHVIWSFYLLPIMYNLQNLFLCNRNLVSFFSAYNFLFRMLQYIISGISIFIQFNYTRVLPPVFIKKNSRIEPPVFLNIFYKKSSISFP